MIPSLDELAARYSGKQINNFTKYGDKGKQRFPWEPEEHHSNQMV